MGSQGHPKVRRRSILHSMSTLGLAVAAPVLFAACGSSASTASPPTAPAASSAPAPTSAPATAPAAAPTTAAQPAAAATSSTVQVKLNFWKSPHSPQEAQLWQPILNAFSQKYPGVQATDTVIPWNSFDAKFTAAFASGDPPDVFYMPDEWIPKYASQAQMYDLSSIVTGEKLTPVYPQVFWASSTYKGKIYGIPFLAVVQAILINQSLLESAGVAIPTSWEEIRAAAKKLTDPSKGTYGLDLNNANATAPLLGAGGATVMSSDLHQIAANTAGGVQAWTVSFQNIGAEDKSIVPLSFTSDQVTALDLKGKVAMMWQEESSIVSQFRKQAPDMKLDVIPLPKVSGTSGHESAWYNVGYMCISQATPHLQQATDLLNFVSTKDVQQKYVVAGVDLIPAMTDVKPTNLDPVVAKYLTFIPEGIGPTVSTHWPDVKQKLYQAAQSVMSGQKSAKDALNQFGSDVTPELDGN